MAEHRICSIPDCDKRCASIAKRFWRYVSPRGASECWEWQGYRDPLGYGKINYRPSGAHRVSWILHFGDIPEGMLVCHRCDNPSCVNPGHLFLGSNADNMADRNRKGRNARGSSAHSAVLTETDIPTIRDMIKRGVPQIAIAANFGVSHATIRNISCGRNWRHV